MAQYLHNVKGRFVLKSSGILLWIISIAGCAHRPQYNTMSQKQLLITGQSKLMQNKYAQARGYFSAALRNNPRDCQAQLFNGLSYHMAAHRHYASFDMAESAYRAAHILCPSDPWPMYLSGVAYLAMDNNFLAEKSLKAAYLSQGYPNLYISESYLYTLIKAHDYMAADRVAKSILKKHPYNPFALEVKMNLTNPAVIKRYMQVHKPVFNQSANTKKFEQAEKNQIMVSAIFILDKEVNAKDSGHNILDNLRLTYHNNFAWHKNELAKNLNRNINPASPPPLLPGFNEDPYPWASMVMNKISLSDLAYNLNIYNTTETHASIMARPTLMATLNQPSKYFSGINLIVGMPTTGNSSGSEIQQFPIGLTLNVTPTLISNKGAVFHITLNRENLENNVIVPGSSFAQIGELRDSNSATMAINYGQTAILSAFSEDDRNNTDSGVPGVKAIPLLGRFFGRKQKYTSETNVVVLITPMPYQYGEINHVEKRLLSFVSPVSSLSSTVDKLLKKDFYQSKYIKQVNDINDKYLIESIIHDERQRYL